MCKGERYGIGVKECRQELSGHDCGGTFIVRFTDGGIRFFGSERRRKDDDDENALHIASSHRGEDFL